MYAPFGARMSGFRYQCRHSRPRHAADLRSRPRVRGYCGAQGAHSEGARHQPGHSTWPQTQEVTMAESYTGEAYCVKCKAKKNFTGHVEEKNGRRMAKGKCPDCGTTLNRILGKA